MAKRIALQSGGGVLVKQSGGGNILLQSDVARGVVGKLGGEGGGLAGPGGLAGKGGGLAG